MARESARENKPTTTTISDNKFFSSFMHEEEEDLLEPQFYPDAALFRTSLEILSKEEEAFKKNLTSNKATLRALAPYLRILHKDQRRKIESAKRVSPKAGGVKKKSKDHIISVVPDLSTDPELVSSIIETGTTLKNLINAFKVFVYLVNSEKMELKNCVPSENLKESLEETIEIKEGSTMAAFAAFRREIIISRNVWTDSRFPQGLDIPDALAKFGLCVPIKTPDDDLVAIYEFLRHGLSAPFDKKDVETVVAVTGWIGAGVLQKAIYRHLQRQYTMTQYLQQLSFHYHCNQVNSDNALSDIVLFARETIEAEHCIFFLVIKTTDDCIVVEEYEQQSENSKFILKKYSKKVIRENSSYLYKVLAGRKIVNIHGSEINESDPSPSVRSILCVPIQCGCKVLGALQLTNKCYAENFSHDDEITLMTFSSYFSIQLYHNKAKDCASNAEIRKSVITDLLNYQIKPCSHNLEAIKRKRAPAMLPATFFTFSWYPSLDDMPHLAEITISMFQEVLGDTFMLLNNVPKFILTVQSCYRPNPYHNFLHAFVVTHTMANIISRYHYIFNGLERKGLMVAALCHDVDHRGYTNNFIQLTKHYLSSLYSSSHLENHHFAVAKMIIQRCSMFSYLKPGIYDTLINGIYKYIIATDLSLYFQCRMELMRIADERTFSFKNASHRHLVMSLIMTMCDLSGQTKPMHISRKITEDVYEEFFQQGDIEKKMGYVPIPTMDRDKKDMILENQVQFLSFAVIPCIETVSRIFSMLSPMLEDTKSLLKQWKKLVREKEQRSSEESLTKKSVNY